MTDIEVLLGNGYQMLFRIGSALVGIWALFFFLKTLWTTRDPVRLVIAAATIVAAAAVWKLVPTLVQTGENTGDQMGGGGGAYSMGTTPSIGIDYSGLDAHTVAFDGGQVRTAAPALTSVAHDLRLVTVSIAA